MDAALWRSEGTFASFYLRELTPSDTLGSLVASQTLVTYEPSGPSV